MSSSPVYTERITACSYPLTTGLGTIRCEKAWIIRATANACKDSLRAAHRRNVDLEAAAATPAPAAPDSDVLDAVMALPRKYREAVYLHYYEGYSVREIASLLGQSESAVSAHLSRGRKSLRTTLGGDLYEQRV